METKPSINSIEIWDIEIPPLTQNNIVLILKQLPIYTLIHDEIMLYSHMMHFLCLLKAIYIIKLDIGSHHQINLLGSSRHCSLLPRVGPTSRVRKESNAPELYNNYSIYIWDKFKLHIMQLHKSYTFFKP